MQRLLCAIVLGCLAAGCSSRPALRANGDPDGVSVSFGVTYDREVLDALMPGGPGFSRNVVVQSGYYAGGPWGDPFGHPWHHHHHHHHGWYGHGFVGAPLAYEPSTSLSLLAGDGPAQAQLFRLRVSESSESFSLPIRAGRRVVVTLQASGGRQGWQVLGEFDAAPGQIVRISLDGSGPRLSITPPPAPIIGPVAPASALPVIPEQPPSPSP
ncbi:MAG: hypothetical protein H0W72_13005 [Planctomycetes bacterium]|nr:hypothetical protein [Planctomycetota bacterium]